VKKTVEDTIDIADKTAPILNTPLLYWLEQQGGSNQRLQKYIDEIIYSIKKLYCTGRQFQAVSKFQSYGLSTTQWGHLYDIAKSNRSFADMESALFSAPDALCKSKHNEEWMLTRNEKGYSLTDWLHEQFNQLKKNNSLNEKEVSVILTRVAKKARTQNEQWLKGNDLEYSDVEQFTGGQKK